MSERQSAENGALYCAPCRAYFVSEDETGPPHAAMEAGGEHVHPITRKRVTPPA